MQIREFSKPVTSKQLNESLATKFGYKVQLENFSNGQLEDARNKLRTKISQFEVNESFDAVHENHDYQKTRMFLDVINQEIMEREDCVSKDEGDIDGDGDHDMDDHKAEKKEKTDEGYAINTFRARGAELSVPQEWIDNAVARIQLGESDTDELKAELLVRYDLNESAASWLLLEGEGDKAEIIMATKDMVDRITGWLEDVAAMKAEQLLELQDSIRETLGSDVAQAYTDAVKPALEAIYTALETSRQGLSAGLATVSGEEAPATMGAGPAPAPELGAAPEAMPGEEELGAPEEAGADLGAMPSAEAGREKRESIEYSRRLGILLNSKKK